MFKSEFKIVAEYFRTRLSNQKYTGSKEKLHHVNETLKTFSALTGDDSFEKVYNEGRTEEQERIIMNLIESNAGTIEQIAAWVKLPVKEVQKIARKVPVNA